MDDQTVKASAPPEATYAELAAPYLYGVGAIILGVLGFFWLGWGYGWVPWLVHLSARTGIAFGAGWLPLYATTAILLLWAVRAWRRGMACLGSGPHTGREMWHQHADPFKRILRHEAMGVGLVMILGLVLRRWDLLAPGISLVLGLHFLPLGRLFRIPAYYVVAAVIIAADALWLVLLKGPAITVAVGLSTGAVFWVTAIHLLLRLSRRMEPHALDAAPVQPAR